MKLHSDIISPEGVQHALSSAKRAARVTWDVYLVKFEIEGSRSRRFGYQIQLGTEDQFSGPGKSRHYKNPGMGGTNYRYRLWAATYQEWGWFIAELFDMDPEATFGPYKSEADFHAQTKNAFLLEG